MARRTIADLERLLAERPKDAQVLVKLAELHLKAGDKIRGVDFLVRAAEACSGDMQGLKTVALLKEATRHAPSNAALRVRLADAYAALGLSSEAYSELESALRLLGQFGDGELVQRILDRLARLHLHPPQ